MGFYCGALFCSVVLCSVPWCSVLFVEVFLIRHYPVSTDTKLGRDQLLWFPCVWRWFCPGLAAAFGGFATGLFALAAAQTAPGYVSVGCLVAASAPSAPSAEGTPG